MRFDDLRHEYASRLAERGVPLSQIQDLLGDASIVMTERYDNQRPEAPMAASPVETAGGVALPYPAVVNSPHSL